MNVSKRIASELSEHGLEAACFEWDSPLFDPCLCVAHRAYDLPIAVLRSHVDRHSRIYALLDRGAVVATLTATDGRRGPVDGEECFPPGLVTDCHACFTTPFRLAVDPGVRCAGRLSSLIMRAALADSAVRGTRLVLMAAKEPLARFYERLGFVRLIGGARLHARLATPHVALAYPISAGHDGAFRDLAEEAGLGDHAGVASAMGRWAELCGAEVKSGERS